MMDMPLPPPLVPACVDLQDFAFFPMEVARLRDSMLAVEASGDEFRAAVLLWCVAWHQVPAASLPDNDMALAKYAGFGRTEMAEWMAVRENALRGFVRCSDGRLYHRTLAEKAMDAWDGKLRQRHKRECERIKKAAQRAQVPPVYPTFDEWKGHVEATGQDNWEPSAGTSQGMSLGTNTGTSLGHAQGHDGDVPRESHPLKGQGIGTGDSGEGQRIGTEDQELPPKAPKGASGTEERQKTFKAWIASLPDGAPAIPEDHHAFAYAARAGIPQEFVTLAWHWFERKYGVEKPRHRQVDWPSHFRNALAGRWGKLWYFDAAGACQLTSDGEQLRRVVEAEAREEAA